MPEVNYGQSEHQELASKYKPLLVLYPEIGNGSRRQEHYHPGHAAGQPPIDQDYHPRDIGIVFDNAFLPGFRRRFQKMSRPIILDTMSANEVDHINLVNHGSVANIDKYWQGYAEIPQQHRDTYYPRTAYARVIHGTRRYADYLLIQYWLAYFFDDWANVHEMDWEMASIVIRKTSDKESPVCCAYQAHMGGFRLAWSHVEKVDDDRRRTEAGTHPVVYVANGSHACYFHDDPVYEATAALVGPKLSRLINTNQLIRRTFSDYIPSFEEGDKYFPEVQLIPEPDSEGRWHNEWRWLNFIGNWGAKGKVSWKERLTLPIEEDGPTGPNRKGIRWSEPFLWIESECFDVESKSWILTL